MITASFRHLPGLGSLRERQLWRRGFRTWADLPKTGLVLSPKLDDGLRAGVAESERRFASGALDWFAARLPPGEQWRLLPHLLSEAVFLDIETAATGSASPTARKEGEPEDVTVIGLYDRAGARALLAGRDRSSLVPTPRLSGRRSSAAIRSRCAGWSSTASPTRPTSRRSPRRATNRMLRKTGMAALRCP